VDAVGGAMLARVLGQLRHRGSAAAVGNAGGVQLPATVIPFLLRGVNLLGIDSVQSPIPEREAAWARIARDLPMDRLDAMSRAASLEELPELGRAILGGGIQGRVVVDL
jgi:acrylyl-CoA reductase (NADPH)